MNDRHGYQREKLYQATHSLVGVGDIRDRLESAAITISVLRPEDFPDDLQDQFFHLWRALTAREAKRGEGTIAATVRELDDEEAKKLAQEIFDLYIRLRGGI